MGGRGSLGIRKGKINAFGPDGWNSDAFAGGLASGLLSSGSTFIGSSVSNGINVALGASWNKKSGGFTQQLKAGYDDFRTNMMALKGNLIGGFAGEVLNNITGVSDGFTFNILNAKDFGLESNVGLFAVTLGGSKGLSAGISSDGYDLSYSGIKDMVFGMNRVKDYNTAMADKTGVMQKIYAVQNYALYSGLSYDSDFVQALDAYMFNGNPDELSFNFDTEDNKKEGNTIYIDKKLISGLISTHNGVIGDINQMAVLTAKIGHEYKHDGKNGADEEVTKQVQDILSANPSLSKAQLKELLLAQGMDEEDVDKAIGNVFEDISCHAFEASIWGGLKGVFGVSNFEEDSKYLAYYSEDNNFFTKYVSSFYMLGQEKDIGLSGKSHEEQYKEQYEMIIQEYKNKAKNGILINLEDKVALQLLLDARNSYINELHIENYTATNFNYDLQSWYGLNLIQGNNTQLSLERDYQSLIYSQLMYTISDEQWNSWNCTTEQQKVDYLKKFYGNAFNNMFNLMLNNETVRTNFSIIKDSIASHFYVKDIFSFSFEQGTSNISSSSTNVETVNGYSNSIMWMFEMYQKYTANSTTAYDFAANGYTGQGINNTFFQYYLVQDSNQLQTLGNLLEERIINVKDSETTDGYSRTHFIANINYLINLFTDIRDGVQGIDGISDWESFDWREGYRPIADGGSIKNGHTCNCAVDFLNIQVENISNQTVYLSAEQQFELLMHFINSGHYQGWKEWKVGEDLGDTDGDGQHEYAGGYHLGTITMGDNSVVFGSTKEESKNAMEILLASLGIESNFSNYYTCSNEWYYINYSAINAFLNGNNNTTTNTGN